MPIAPIATLTDSMVTVTQSIVDLILANCQDATPAGTLAVDQANVYYGDQLLIPRFPSITAESLPKSRDLVGTHTFRVLLQSSIVIYHEKIQASSVTKKENEQLSEQVEDLLNSDIALSLEGLVIPGTGWVSVVQPARINRESVMMQVTRLIWRGEARERY